MASGGNNDGGSGYLTEEFYIPVGLVGAGKLIISRIQAESGCQVLMDPNPTAREATLCFLQGSLSSIKRARDLVMDIISSKSHLGMGATKPKPVSTSCVGVETVAFKEDNSWKINPKDLEKMPGFPVDEWNKVGEWARKQPFVNRVRQPLLYFLGFVGQDVALEENEVKKLGNMTSQIWSRAFPAARQVAETSRRLNHPTITSNTIKMWKLQKSKFGDKYFPVGFIDHMFQQYSQLDASVQLNLKHEISMFVIQNKYKGLYKKIKKSNVGIGDENDDKECTTIQTDEHDETFDDDDEEDPEIFLEKYLALLESTSHV